MPLKKISTFTVQYMQILNEKGEVDKSLEPEISREDLLQLYRTMVLSRKLDERMLKMQRQGRLGTLPVCIGQEASSGAVALAMTQKDWMVGAYRELAARLLRGEPLTNPMYVYNGYEEGVMIADSPRTLPLSIVLASQIPQAVGLAYAMKLKGEKDSAVVTFFGDGSTSEGDFHEGLNFAAVWKAPVVFVCQNNQWAISTPRKKQTRAESIAQKGIAYGMPSIQVDGNDVLAVYKATRDALDRAYRGEGPTLIEAVTYRMMMHTTADDPTKYRDDAEVKEWEDKDPIDRFRVYLTKKRLWNKKKEEELLKEITEQITNAVKEFESPVNYPADAPFDYLFGTKVEAIEEQRAAFLEDIRKDF